MSGIDLEILSSGAFYTLKEVCEGCGLETETLVEWVEFGIADPEGHVYEQWRFSPSQVSRIHRALRLQRDMDINLPGLALALDLLDEVACKRKEVERLKQQLGIS